MVRKYIPGTFLQGVSFLQPLPFSPALLLGYQETGGKQNPPCNPHHHVLPHQSLKAMEPVSHELKPLKPRAQINLSCPKPYLSDICRSNEKLLQLATQVSKLVIQSVSPC